MPDLRTEMTKVTPYTPGPRQAVAERPDTDTEVRKVDGKRVNKRAKGDNAVIERLIVLCGNDIKRAAELIGFTDTGLRTSMVRGTLSKTAEIAARGVIAEMQGSKPDYYVYIIKVPKEQRDAVVSVMNALNVGMTTFDLKGRL